MKKTNNVNCSCCNSILSRPISEIKRNTTGLYFCNTICKSEYSYKEISCSICNITFSKKKKDINPVNFCSASCRNKYTGSKIVGNNPNAKVRICKVCNKEYKNSIYHTSPTICAECKELSTGYTDVIKALTLKEYRNRYQYVNKHQSLLYANIRQFFRSWNKEHLGKPCQLCSYSKHTEFHHIKPISKFSDESTLNEINDINNLAILCPNCHWEVHNNIITL